jgi:hypothetical protein
MKETTDYYKKLNENNKIYKPKKKNCEKNNDNCFNENECLICYEKVEKNMSKVKCKLCSNIIHYKCYKEFVKKNSNYNNKCCHCSTRSLKFNMKNWWNCCW